MNNATAYFRLSSFFEEPRLRRVNVWVKSRLQAIETMWGFDNGKA